MRLHFRSAALRLTCLQLLVILTGGLASSQTFSATGSLALPLAYQTATQLQNGTILIAGGSDNGPTSTAEIYNPSSGTFSPTNSMSVARYSATASLLSNGTVLVAGGSGDKSAEIYDPRTGNFSRTSGSMTAVRIHATATPLQDGTVLIAGGDTGNWAGTTSAEIYNPMTGTFTATAGSMSTPRTTHSATLLQNGTVLIAGGQGSVSGQTAWNTAEVYSPLTQTFTTVGNMTSARCFQTATLLTDGTVLVTGGQNSSGTILSSAETYTPSSSSFSATGSMNSNRYMHSATSLDDGTVLIAGGSNGNSAVNSAEVYKASARTFTLTGNLATSRQNFAATLLYTGDVLIAGGVNGVPATQFQSSAEVYSYPITESVIYPAYQVTSIIYAPPGNKSQDGYTDTTTSSTTTTIGSSFGTGTTLSFIYGFGSCSSGGFCGSATEAFGISSSNSTSTAFQETYSSATGVANQSNSSSPDAINHNQDVFLIWLNPQLTVAGNESTPIVYSAGLHPTANGQVPLPDILEVSAGVMEANSAGITAVPKFLLNQQIDAKTQQYVPGLASICKNLITAEYNAGTCTLADQCGCTPADFLPILQTDPLLFSNGITNPVSPYAATVSPLAANTSSGDLSDANCGTLPLPNPGGSSCRYVPVPSGLGSTTQAFQSLYGPESLGGNNIPNTFSQGENTQRAQTLGAQTQESVSFSLKGGTTIFSVMDQNSITWTQSQSTGTANGTGYVEAVTLSSSTVGCAQPNDIGIFEDTVYHTFVFQQPPSNSSCTALSPAFYVTVTPNNPNLTALSLGHSLSYAVNVSAWYGFNGTVALSVSGLPAGVTASFSPASITTSGVGSATLTLTAAYSNSTYIGGSTVTVTGTSGGTAQSALFTLTTQPLQYRGYCGVQ